MGFVFAKSDNCKSCGFDTFRVVYRRAMRNVHRQLLCTTKNCNRQSMKYSGKYKIVTGITAEFKINPENPKYFAKFVNDHVLVSDNSEKDAVERLKILYEDYRRKNKLHSRLSNQVLNPYVSTIKFDRYSNIAMQFFGLIGEDDCIQIHDEYTVEDFELSKEQILLLNSTYGLDIQSEDLLVDLFEKIGETYN